MTPHHIAQGNKACMHKRKLYSHTTK